MNALIQRLKQSKALTVLLSVMIACIMWIYVEGEVDSDINDTIRNIPVTIVGQEELKDRELVITAQSKEELDLRLTGKRDALFGLTNKNISFTVDVSGISEEGTYDLLCAIALPYNIAGGGVTINNQEKCRVSLTVERRMKKTVEIQGSFEGSVAKGYQGGEFILSPSEIEIAGPESLIGMVERAQVTLNESNLKESFSGLLPIELVTSDNQSFPIQRVECEASSVYTVYPVMLVKEVGLKVEIEEGGGAAKEHITVDFFPKIITLSGPEEVLADLSEISVGKLELAEIEGDTSLFYPVELPEGVLCDGNFEEIQVTVNFHGLEVKTMKATAFELTNIPEGYRAELLISSLPVLVRGPHEPLEQVKEEQLKVTVDLSGVAGKEGALEAPASVTIAQNPQVGVVGKDHSLRIRLYK